MGSERPNLGSERRDLGSERPDLGSERPDLGSERPDIGSESLRKGGGQRHRAGKIALCGIIGHLPLRGRCPKGESDSQFLSVGDFDVIA